MTKDLIANLEIGDEVRLDIYLSKELNVSRNQIEKLIENNHVFINNKLANKGGLKIKKDDFILINFPEEKKRSENFNLVDFDVPILYEDEYLLVLNKPSGLVVHEASSLDLNEPTLVDWLKSKNYSLSTLNGDERHGIVHRLDRGTTGAIVVAKDNKTHSILSEQLQDRTMGRYYIAVINKPLKEDIIVDAPIGRNPINRLQMAVVDIEKGGRSAKTLFKKYSTSNNNLEEIIVAKLYSGRTHQIRVHLKEIGRNIIGDDLYGFKKDRAKIDTIMLHANTLYFRHPKTDEILFIEAELGFDISKYIKNNFNLEIKDEKIKNIHNLFRVGNSNNRLSI